MGNRAGRRLVAAAGAAGALLLAGCVPSGPPEPDQIAAEFDDAVEPAWSIDVQGIYGEPGLGESVVAVYAQDDEDVLRLEVRDLETGELLWQHAASPGGAWGAPLFDETDSVSRPYPIPSIEPYVTTVGAGEDAREVIVYFERRIDEERIMPGDIVHVADARTGEDARLSITLSEDDLLSEAYLSYTDDSREQVVAYPYSPPWVCGEGPQLCFDEPEGRYLTLDLAQLEVGFTEVQIPGQDPDSEDYNDYGPEWGPGFARVLMDETTGIARTRDGEALWMRLVDELFGDARTRPVSITEFPLIADRVLIQGYQSISDTPELGHQLDLDYAASRRLVAVDAETGATRWLLEGGDALCHAVTRFRAGDDTTVLPMCVATGGMFSYRYDDDEVLAEEPAVVSIAGVDVTDGSVVWEAEHAGDQSVLHVARQLDAVFASGSELAVIALEDGPQLLELANGSGIAIPEAATFVCKAERAGVELEFEGSAFTGGANPIALEYPGGWYHFPCDQDSAPADGWSRGAVRIAGYPAGDGTVVLPTEDGLAAFRLG